MYLPASRSRNKRRKKWRLSLSRHPRRSKISNNSLWQMTTMTMLTSKMRKMKKKKNIPWKAAGPKKKRRLLRRLKIRSKTNSTSSKSNNKKMTHLRSRVPSPRSPVDSHLSSSTQSLRKTSAMTSLRKTLPPKLFQLVLTARKRHKSNTKVHRGRRRKATKRMSTRMTTMRRTTSMRTTTMALMKRRSPHPSQNIEPSRLRTLKHSRNPKNQTSRHRKRF